LKGIPSQQRIIHKDFTEYIFRLLGRHHPLLDFAADSSGCSWM